MLTEFIYGCSLLDDHHNIIKYRYLPTKTLAMEWAKKIDKKYKGRPRINSSTKINRERVFSVQRVEIMYMGNKRSKEEGTYE